LPTLQLCGGSRFLIQVMGRHFKAGSLDKGSKSTPNAQCPTP
jgi:hypothetical protein